MSFALGCPAPADDGCGITPIGHCRSSLGGGGPGVCRGVDCILEEEIIDALAGPAQAFDFGWVAEVPIGKPGDHRRLGHAEEVSIARNNCTSLKLIVIE